MYRFFYYFTFSLFQIFFAQEVRNKKSRFPLFELNKGDDDTKNVNWGNFHYENESYRKAAARFSKGSKSRR